jgi:hypothetical protein
VDIVPQQLAGHADLAQNGGQKGANLGNGSDEESDENKNAIETKSANPKG